VCECGALLKPVADHPVMLSACLIVTFFKQVILRLQIRCQYLGKGAVQLAMRAVNKAGGRPPGGIMRCPEK